VEAVVGHVARRIVSIAIPSGDLVGCRVPHSPP
jgi:hypothetical protein